MLSEGMTAISSVITFMEGNATFKILLGIAVAGVVVSVVMGIFFRR